MLSLMGGFRQKRRQIKEKQELPLKQQFESGSPNRPSAFYLEGKCLGVRDPISEKLLLVRRGLADASVLGPDFSYDRETDQLVQKNPTRFLKRMKLWLTGNLRQ